MISDLWTLEPEGSPSTAETLRGLGVIFASLDRPSQGFASLSLAFPDDPDWEWNSQWVLRRDGVIAFRGRVATTPEFSGDGSREGSTIELRDAWWDLRAQFTQEWIHVTATGLEPVRTGHAHLGRNTSTRARETTIQALTTIQSAITAMGIAVTIEQEGLAEIYPPVIDAANRSISDILRELLRRHPSAVAFIQSTESGDTLKIIDRRAMSTTTLDSPGDNIGKIKLKARPDLVADSVHIIYESEASSSAAEEAGEGDTPLIRTRRRLCVHKDVYPEGSEITTRSYVGTLLVPGFSFSNDAPTPHRVSIGTKPLPQTGATGTTVEKWWLQKLKLDKAGLTTDDVRVPTSTVNDIQSHRLRFDWDADDDPLNDPESPDPINPNSTYVWRPPNVSDLPRELTKGQIAEWMKVRAASLIADVTLGIRKTTVDALPERDRRRVMALNPKEGEVQGVAAYLVDASIPVMATTAKTKLYSHYPETGQDAADSTAASVLKAQEEAIIPDLAQRMWEERQTLTHEGSITLTEEEAGEALWIDRLISVNAEGKPTWAEMSAITQRESLNLNEGTTVLDLETPQHLSERDASELHEAERRARATVTSQKVTPPPPSEEESDDSDEVGQGGVFPGSVGPTLVPATTYGGPSTIKQPWGIVAAGSGSGGGSVQLQLLPGTVLQDADDVTSVVAFAGDFSAFLPTAGQILSLSITEKTPTTGTLELGGEWDGYPNPYATEGTGVTFELSKYYFPLWRFYSADGDGHRVKLADGLWGLKLCSDHLRVINGAYKKPSEPILPVPVFIASHRAIPAS